MKTKLGFKRLSKATPENLLKRLKEIEKAILNDQYNGKMLKIAKQAYNDHLSRYRYSIGLKKYDNEINQMIFPEMLRHMGITPIQDLNKKQNKKSKKLKHKKAS